MFGRLSFSRRDSLKDTTQGITSPTEEVKLKVTAPAQVVASPEKLLADLSIGESPVLDTPPPVPKPEPKPTPTPRRSLLGRILGANTPESPIFDAQSTVGSPGAIDDEDDEQAQLKREELEEKARISAEVARYLVDRIKERAPDDTQTIESNDASSTVASSNTRRMSFARRLSDRLSSSSPTLMTSHTGAVSPVVTDETDRSSSPSPAGNSQFNA